MNQQIIEQAPTFWSRHRPFLASVLKYGLGLALLVWVTQSNWHPPPGQTTGGIANALRGQVQVRPLVLGCVVYLMSVCLTFVRWHVLVRAQGLPFCLRDAVRLGLVGLFMNTLTPAGDVVKAAFIAREQQRRTVAVATVVMDRAIGLFGLITLMVLFSTLFWLSGQRLMHDHRSLQIMALALGSVVLASALAWLAVGVLSPSRVDRTTAALERIPRVGHSVAELWRALWLYRLQGRRIALALTLTLASHGGFVLTYYFAAQVVLPPSQGSLVPSLEENLLMVPIGLVCQAGIPTPGRVGGGEYVFAKLYALVGKSEELGVLASLVARLMTVAVALVGYFTYLRMEPAVITLSNGGIPVAAVARRAA